MTTEPLSEKVRTTALSIFHERALDPPALHEKVVEWVDVLHILAAAIAADREELHARVHLGRIIDEVCSCKPMVTPDGDAHDPNCLRFRLLDALIDHEDGILKADREEREQKVLDIIDALENETGGWVRVNGKHFIDSEELSRRIQVKERS